MEPGSRVELPPRGADLSFLSNNPDTDTPSKWLTFNSTPGGGNTTPGTAFGSPFWGSLAAANGQGSSSTPTTANFHHRGGHSPKSYSPSKELNPFELSFFPKHNEHLLAPTTNAASSSSSTSKDILKESARPSSGGSKENVNPQAGGEGQSTTTAEGGNTSLSSSVSSLKRPFSDAVASGVVDDNAAQQRPLSLQSDASSRIPIDETGHPLPSWKRPKIEDLHSSNPSSSDLSSNNGTSIYAPSPSNLNPSPDSGSPASSLVPTPSIQHAILPPNATPLTAAAGATFSNDTSNVNSDGKMAIPIEQIEVAKLAPNGVMGNVNTVPVHPHQQHLYTGPAVQSQHGQVNPGIMTQSVPPPLSSAAFTSQHQTQHQPGGHTYGGYTGYMPPHSQQQPIILPPKTLQQAQQQQQRTVSPVTAHPPHSARQPSLDQSQQHHQQQQQQSPVLANNNTIPYANGRGPARPLRTTRSSTNNNNRRGSTAPAPNEANAAVKQEEDMNGNMNIYDSSYNALNPANYNTTTSSSANNNTNISTNGQGNTSKTTSSAASGNNTKKGKKNNETRASSVSGSSSGKKGNNNNNASSSTNVAGSSGNGDGAAGNSNNGEGQGDDEEEGDDEHKRKAFLERNRQAACRSRQKKKEWINNLETHAARLQSENQSLAAEIDVLRKELFALRHTLSFHERSGCTAAAPPHHHQQQAQSVQNALPAQAAPIPVQAPHQQQQQQQRPEWRQQQQQQPSSQQQTAPPSAGPYQPAFQSNVSHISQPPAIVQTHPSPHSHASSQQTGPPPPVHIQTQPQPLSAARAAINGGPTLAPSALQGLTLQVTQPSNQLGSSEPPLLSSSQSQRAPPKLNLSPASLQPQSLLGGSTGSHNQNSQLPSQSNQLGTVGDINRPGSAGATFGLLTPNFADLFNGAMGKLGNGGQTPGFGAGLLFTPGGIMSSGGMLGGGSYNNSTGYNMSTDLPNTFGLSIQDIPIRPASAPPTPSPAIDSRLVAPSQDYFSSKNMSSHLGTSAAFADFLAAYPNNALHANNTGSVLA